MSIPSESPYRALIVDWGGVLTGSISDAVRRWAVAEEVDISVYGDIMRDWLGPEAEIEARLNPIHALELGQMAVPRFEETLAEEMTRRSGVPQVREGLLERMFEQFEHAHDMNALVRRARNLGIQTALLSNSWGDYYPRHLWDGMFDVVVISGEVGMRKPDPAIYRHTLELMGQSPQACVFVDDLPHNVEAAVRLGMAGVLHVNYEGTLGDLQVLFGEDLR